MNQAGTQRGAGDPVVVLGLTWIVSCLAFLPAFASAQVSRTALALLPWLVRAGWPGASGGRRNPVELSDPGRGSFRARGLPLAALAAPLVVLGFELDRASGWSSQEVLHTALLGAALVLLSTAAAGAAARAGGRLARGYALAWLLTFLLLPLFEFVTRGAGSGGGWLARVAGASPVAWALARVRADSGSPGRLGLESLALVLILWLAFALPDVRPGTRRAGEGR